MIRKIFTVVVLISVIIAVIPSISTLIENLYVFAIGLFSLKYPKQ